MKYHIVTAISAFLLGLSIGSLALGQKRHPASAGDIRHSMPQQTDSAPNAADSSPDSAASIDNADTTVSNAKEALDGPVDIKLGSMVEPEHLQLMSARWAQQGSMITQLDKRISELEQQLVSLKSGGLTEEDTLSNNELEALPVATPEDRRIALLAAGVTQTIADEIVSRQSELELERLELQDQAMREGWYRTDRYFEDLTGLNSETVDLRAEIGEQAYDEYLYQTGEFNRVQVTSVIQGSAAELSGLQPGDIVETYGNETVYGYSDLRSATANGERDEPVPVLIRRGDTFIETEIPRGPMGVRVEALTVPPSG